VRQAQNRWGKVEVENDIDLKWVLVKMGPTQSALISRKFEQSS
jgi:hypothetical protein